MRNKVAKALRKACKTDTMPEKEYKRDVVKRVIVGNPPKVEDRELVTLTNNCWRFQYQALKSQFKKQTDQAN